MDICQYVCKVGKVPHDDSEAIDEEKIFQIVIDSIETFEKENNYAILWAAQYCALTTIPWDMVQQFSMKFNQLLQLADGKSADYVAINSALTISIARLYSRKIQLAPIDAKSMEKLAQGSRESLLQKPKNYHCIKAAAEILEVLDTKENTLSKTYKEPLLDEVALNLNAGNSNRRIQTLRLLCQVLNVSWDKNNSALAILLELETHPLGADSGRHAEVNLGRIQNMMEYSKVPSNQMKTILYGLLGMLHFKLSSYWAPASKALAAAIMAAPDEAWPILFQSLATTQKELQKYGARHNEEDTIFQVSDKSSLQQRYQGYLQEGDGKDGSDAAARLSHLLRCLASLSNSVLQKYSKEWVSLFLAYISSEQNNLKPLDDATEEGEEENQEDQSRKHIPPKIWRSILRDWFKVFLSLKGITNVAESERVLESVAGQLLSIDPLVQKTALNVLKLFKIPWLNPYHDSLLRIIDNKTLRAELTSFPLAVDSSSVRKDDQVIEILPEHRQELVSILIAVLFPRMRKRNGRLGGKGTRN